MGKGPFSFKRSSSIRRRPPKKFIGPPPSPFPSPPQPFRSPPLSNVHINSTNTNNNNNNLNAVVAGGGGVKGKKKAGGARFGMRFDRFGGSELVECDKNAIIRRAAIPARDLRILGPVFSHSSSILAREKAMVVNLEFIKAIVTTEEVLLLDPLRQEKRQSRIEEASPLDELASGMIVSSGKQWLPVPEAVEGVQCDLPFEFQVLEIALEVVCTYLNSSVADLDREAYPVLDELARNVSTKNLELVRSLKSILTRLLARVQKVRDELEHLLDDNEDMAHLYLTRKWMQNQYISAPYLRRLSSNRSGSLVNSNNMDYDDVEDLEMLLEAYFMQLDGTRNKILSVREYIDDTEDYVNIQLDNQRNELIQLQLTLTIASFAIAVETLISGIFGMNIPCILYTKKGIFEPFVGGITAFSMLLFFLIFRYARWKKLLDT
ncbi:magnesium transporter MRS2-4-like [Pyrus ussuriensis x Pyrus communis]|uniref:Magnesium transporter n=1 Tax=Pyrus ussuriensis x Pyrus communis TaxID=2448454 RepID=A0A5N5H0U3_9ROSA|nr:magnesium transporter MRS2-4-like [Pyrus ussuriensis x Pyrus communis]